MAKRNRVKVTKLTRKNKQSVLDRLCDSIESGNAEGFGYGGPNGDVWVDLDTGDVDIIYPDGSSEKIAGNDPRAQDYWNPNRCSNG